MSDLASPFVVVADADEADAFWCFASSMEELKGNFLHDGSGMRLKLQTMERLLQRMDAGLHAHLRGMEALNLFCCFRWFLVRFKREFSFDDVCRVWEVMRSGWAGDEFEYFVALAVLDEHRDAIVRHLVTFDELLKYTNDLANTIPVAPTLEAAELLYLRFRVRAASLGALPVVVPPSAGAATGDGDGDGDSDAAVRSRRRGRADDSEVPSGNATDKVPTAVPSASGGAGLAGPSRGGIRLLEVLDRMAAAEAEARAAAAAAAADAGRGGKKAQ
ncbi:GTPase activating protein [Cladochytrium tenue]|nr:GTPase activating protein [Cladochytrium tenue]